MRRILFAFTQAAAELKWHARFCALMFTPESAHVRQPCLCGHRQQAPCCQDALAAACKLTSAALHFSSTCWSNTWRSDARASVASANSDGAVRGASLSRGRKGRPFHMARACARPCACTQRHSWQKGRKSKCLLAFAHSGRSVGRWHADRVLIDSNTWSEPEAQASYTQPLADAT